MTAGGLPRGFAALTRAYLLDAFRSRTSLFWNFAFPLFFLFAFAVGLADGRPDGVTYLMPGLFTLTIVAISFAGVSYRLIADREKEILRRFRTTPVNAGTVVTANAGASVVVLGVALLLLTATAFLAFRIRVAGGLPRLLAVLGAGAAAFVPLGLILGSLTPSMRTAPAVTNAIFFPLIFVSGAAIPFAMLPGWVQEVGRFVPATYLVDALHAVMVRDESWATLGPPLAILLATGLVGGGLSAWLFRWESREPVGGGRLLAATTILALFLGGLGWLGPPLSIARDAGPLEEDVRDRIGASPASPRPAGGDGRPALYPSTFRSGTRSRVRSHSITRWASLSPCRSKERVRFSTMSSVSAGETAVEPTSSDRTLSSMGMPHRPVAPFTMISHSSSPGTA